MILEIHLSWHCTSCKLIVMLTVVEVILFLETDMFLGVGSASIQSVEVICGTDKDLSNHSTIFQNKSNNINW